MIFILVFIQKLALILGIELASPSLTVGPVNLIHTSEGVRQEHHLLIDIFSPPRRDFIAKGWVQNAGDYVDPMLK